MSSGCVPPSTGPVRASAGHVPPADGAVPGAAGPRPQDRLPAAPAAGRPGHHQGQHLPLLHGNASFIGMGVDV